MKMTVRSITATVIAGLVVALSGCGSDTEQTVQGQVVEIREGFTNDFGSDSDFFYVLIDDDPNWYECSKEQCFHVRTNDVVEMTILDESVQVRSLHIQSPSSQ